MLRHDPEGDIIGRVFFRMWPLERDRLYVAPGRHSTLGSSSHSDDRATMRSGRSQ